MSPLLEARGVVKTFRPPGAARGRSARIRAVDGVDLTLAPGECVAVVGESGSGKTTLARCLTRLIEPDAGEIRFRGEDLRALRGRQLRRRRRAFQMVFQDPFDSLSPRLRVGELLAEPLAAHRLVPRRGIRARAEELLDRVGLPPEAADRFPHEFSGGQRQRIGIARALATEPDLLVADEPVSALDASIRGQVLRLLRRLREELGLAVLLIAHDLTMVEWTAPRVVVLHRGRIVEEGPTAEVFSRPSHPYTAELLRSVPRLPAGTWRGPPGRSQADGAVPEADAEPDRR